MFYKIGSLKNFSKLIGKNLCWSLFLNKIESLTPAVLLKKRLAQVLSCEVWETSKNVFFIEYLWWLVTKTSLRGLQIIFQGEGVERCQGVSMAHCTLKLWSNSHRFVTQFNDVRRNNSFYCMILDKTWVTRRCVEGIYKIWAGITCL